MGSNSIVVPPDPQPRRVEYICSHCTGDEKGVQMVLRRLNRQPGLDGLDLFRRLDAPKVESLLGDEGRVQAVFDDLQQVVHETLSRPTSVRGWRAQALFASLVAALVVLCYVGVSASEWLGADGENLES